MSRIKSKNTKPEKIIRSLLFRLGFRFRLSYKDLPCKPDLVMPKYKIAIFVNGCFWHRHANCKYAYTPKSRVEFWENKFRENLERDARNEASLKKLEWKVVTIWECETKNLDQLSALLLYYITNSKLDQFRESAVEYE